MKSISKTLIAATLALGATAANANILADKSLDSEMFLSVYDADMKRTFTADLGQFGLTMGTVIDAVDNPAFLVNVDLTAYSAWADFANGMSGNVKYVVAVAGLNSDLKNAFVSTGADQSFWPGKSDATVGIAADAIMSHVGGINADVGIQDAALHFSTVLNDGEGKGGEHTGSEGLWANLAWDPNVAYGEEGILSYVSSVKSGRKTSAQQAVAAFTVNLSGDNLRVGQVPVPAAVWMFGSALLGLAGVARKKK